MKRFLTIITILAIALCTQAQNAPNCHRLYLIDKKDSPYSIDKPEQFLSPRAIEKRARFNIAITEEDLPVNPTYIQQILNIDSTIQIISQSKWTNTLVVYCPKGTVPDSVLNLRFVNYSKPVGHYQPYIDTISITPYTHPFPTSTKKKTQEVWTPEQYGNSYAQIAIHTGDQLPAAGFKGEGMLIAVIDAGWGFFDTLSCFKSLYDNGQIKGYRNLVPDHHGLYDTTELHGSYVTSIMATTWPDSLIGTAPEADYYFIRSENADIEEPLEEDLWMMAVELADSLGADVINSSLGYTTFDDSIRFPSDYRDCNGNSLISQVAAKAVEKGIIVCVSAGNSGDKPWHFVGRPADARNVLSIGAIDVDAQLAPFSSVGPSFDGRIKPDVVSVGWNTFVVNQYECTAQGNGTSFSSPMMAGLSACLWQSLPDKSATELIQIIKESSHNYSTPNNYVGYGIPDVYQAYLSHTTGIRTPKMDESQVTVSPNPCETHCTLFSQTPLNQVQINLYNTTGQLIQHTSGITIRASHQLDVSQLKSGIYLLQITGYSQKGERLSTFQKIIKQ